MACLWEIGGVFMIYLLNVTFSGLILPASAFAMAVRGHGLWFLLLPAATAIWGGERIARGKADHVPAVITVLIVIALVALSILTLMHKKYEGNI